MMLRNISKIIVCLIALNCFNLARAYAPSYYSANSKLNYGNWVKIKVTEIGMQEITYDQLREWGFNDPEKVCVYGYGGTRLTKNTFDEKFPDDLPAQPVYYGEDKIVFYGEPDYCVNLGADYTKIEVLRNIYASAGYYLLSDCTPGASELAESKKYTLSNILTKEVHYNIVYIENEITNPGQAGALFFDENLADCESKTYTFNAPKADEANHAYFKYTFAAKAPSYAGLSVEFDHPSDLINKAIHRQAIPSSLESQYYYTSDGEIDFYPISDSNSYSFRISAPSNASFCAIDNAYLSYSRKNDFANESQMRMSFVGTNQNTNFKITNSNENVQVWNITDPLNIYPHSLRYYEDSKNCIGTFQSKSSNSGSVCLIAFDPTKELHKVELVEQIATQNLHNQSTPDMIIITNDLCQPYAEQVAQAHREHQNMDVLVVNDKLIFNEFSSGTPSAMAYRRFLKMHYDRNNSKLKYLLLFGEGSWDNRGVVYPKEGRLLTYQAEDVEDARSAAKAFCGDSYFGMLEDDFNPTEVYKAPVALGIGRIPAKTEANAQAATNKIIKYLQNPPTQPIFNRALIISDEGDSYGHIAQQEENIDSITSIYPSITCTRAVSTFYPSSEKDAPEARDLITQALIKGQILFSFAGHGAEFSFGPKILWDVNSVKNTSYSYPPFGMFATCDAFAFDRKEGGMAEQSLYKEDGGFIATVAASRTVYMQFNQYINNAFTCELFKASNDELIGDVFRKARNYAATKIEDRTLGVNTLCYNLAGDPALPLYKPSFNVATTSINGTEPTDSSYPVINPLSKNTIAGKIVDAKGNLQEYFNGTITLTIYDGPSIRKAQTKKSGGTSSIVITQSDSIITTPTKSITSADSISIVFDETQLTEISAPVKNGTFEISLVTPVPQKANSINRITYFAISEDKKERATGNFNYVTIAEYNAETAINDTSAPIIEQCYINDPSFNNGDIVESDFMLHATIASDESGINTSIGALGQSTTLTLDGKKTYPNIASAISFNSDGSASLSFQLKDIEDGHHSLTLSVNDNAGNRTNRTISFIVINRSATVALNIAETPARSEATFSLNHNFLEEPTGRIVIEDMKGNTIFTKNNCAFPYTWNLKDSKGEAVADGNYKAYVILNGGKQYGSSDKIDVIVVK